jgi:hypothetical protein
MTNSVDILQTQLAKSLESHAQATEKLAWVKMQLKIYQSCSKRLYALSNQGKDVTCRIVRLEQRWDRELDRLEAK